MGKPRACDVCSLRKIRCSGTEPCLPCLKANFDCSYAKKPLKPGPKGPRATTSSRIRRRLRDIRSQASIKAELDGRPSHSSNASTPSPQLTDDPEVGWLGDPPPWRWPVMSGPSSITLHSLHAYLDIYHYRMYAVWPVVDRTALLAKLHQDPNDAEAWALAYSVCAGTGAQLRLDADGSANGGPEHYSVIDRFAMEAEKSRAMFDYREDATVSCILIPFFLHMYYSSKKKRSTATLLLREALTLCELLDLDKEAMYATLDLQEQRLRRKVFWLLFITERGTVMQYDAAVVLRNTINLPAPEDDRDPVQLQAFLSLVRLFVVVEGILVGHGLSAGQAFSTEVFTRLQQTLRESPQIPSGSSEVQKTDIWVTQQWMRMLVWQLAMKSVQMTAGSSDDPLSLTYPAHVAKDSLALLSKVSLESVIAHGPGMELKIFEIANTLLDVINCVPSVASSGSALMKQSPQDTFHRLGCLLASLSDGYSRSVNLLQGKMATSRVPFLPIPRFIDLHDEDPNTSHRSNELNPAISPRDLKCDDSFPDLVDGSGRKPSHAREGSHESMSYTVSQPISPSRVEASFVSELPVLDHTSFSTGRNYTFV